MIIRILLSAVAVLALSEFLSGVTVSGYSKAIVVAIVLGLLQAIVQPVLKFLALPITFLTLGLFSFVINAAIIMLADRLVDGFSVAGFWDALIFSLLLGVVQSILFSLVKKK